jgi:hypothetical protein
MNEKIVDILALEVNINIGVASLVLGILLFIILISLLFFNYKFDKKYKGRLDTVLAWNKCYEKIIALQDKMLKLQDTEILKNWRQ